MSYLGAFLVETFLTGFGEAVIPFDNRDFKRAALFGCIRWTLAALSKAEKAAVKSLAALLVLAFLTKDFKASSRFLLRAVLSLSFRTFLMAD